MAEPAFPRPDLGSAEAFDEVTPVRTLSHPLLAATIPPRNRATPSAPLAALDRDATRVGAAPVPTTGADVAGAVAAPVPTTGADVAGVVAAPVPTTSADVAGAVAAPVPSPSFHITRPPAQPTRQRRSWVGWIVGVLTLMVVAGFTLGTRARSFLAGGDPPEVESSLSASSTPSRSPAPTPTETVKPSRLQRAARGEPGAITELGAIDAQERTAAQTLALAAGRAVSRMSALKQLKEDLAQSPQRLEEAEVRSQLLDFARDPETAREALALMASLDGPRSPDLIYEVWTGTPARTDITALAEALVYAKDVRSKATPALEVALALRASKPEACEERKELLTKAIEYGDRRALHLIGRLLRRYGCGANSASDCNSCLRDSDLVTDAMKAVRKRPAPEL